MLKFIHSMKIHEGGFSYLKIYAMTEDVDL